MMQIPFIFRQPGKIHAGQTSDLLVSNYDFMPSVLSFLGLGDKMPQNPKSPGRDFSPALRGQTISDGPNEVFYEMETCRAIRTDRWKFVERTPSGPHELYDMQTDPQERFNVFGQPGTEEALNTTRERLHTFFKSYADPKYDLWNGGTSKATPLSSRVEKAK